MNCKHAANLLSPLLEGELSEASSSQVRQHLHTCPACTAEWTDLQRTTLLLKSDSAAPQPPLPDLYATFQQRLVMQKAGTPLRSRHTRRTSLAWLLPRLAVCVGATCVAATIRHKFFPYNIDERSLLSTASTLSQRNYDGPMHVNEIRHFRSKDGSQFTRFVHIWWHKGYSYTRTSEQKPALSTKPEAKNAEFVLSYRYSTPGGVWIQWNANSRTKTPVRLEWLPSDPAKPASPIQYESDRCASWCQQIVDHGKTAQANVKVGGTFPDTMQYRLSIGDLKAGLKRSDGPDESRDAPDTLTLWFDAQCRFHQSEELYGSPYGYGEHLVEDTIVDYPAQPLPQLTAPGIPRNRPVVLAYKLPVKTTTIPPERFVKPVWLTMPEKEEDKVRHAIKIFAEMWRARNAVRLRNVVDLDRPLEITRPDKRAGLTREDVWQRVWLKRMQSQPNWSYLALNTEFAFEAAPRLLNEVPLNVGEWNLDRALPGLNVLVWMNAGMADGQTYITRARLYLVKRPSGWKVYQFGLLHGDAPTVP